MKRAREVFENDLSLVCVLELVGIGVSVCAGDIVTRLTEATPC